MYKYRNSINQLRFLTFTSVCGTPDKIFVDAIEKFFKYFVECSLLSDYVLVFERQQNRTLHSHIIARIPTVRETKDFINGNRKMANITYNGKKIENFYQLMRYKFESIIKVKEHLHLDFRQIKQDKVYSENGKFLGSLNHYLTKYMLKSGNVESTAFKQSFRYSKTIKKQERVLATLGDIRTSNLKLQYFFDDGIKCFGKLQIDFRLFRFLDKLRKKELKKDVENEAENELKECENIDYKNFIYILLSNKKECEKDGFVIQDLFSG